MLELLVSTEFLFALAGIIISFIIIYYMLKPSFGGDKIKTRMSNVINQTNAMRLASLSDIADDKIQDTSKSKIKDFMDKSNLIKFIEVKGIRNKMLQAGYRKQRHIYKFYFFRITMPFVLAGIALLYFGGLNPLKMSGAMILLVTLVFAFLGYYSPIIYLNNQIDKRCAAIMKLFPDALDLILISVEAGMSLEATFDLVSKRMVSSSVELAEEMALTKAELSYMASRIEAFQNLSKRINHPSVKAVVSAFVQTEKLGTPLGKTLRIMSQEIRKLQMTEIEKKGASLPSKLAVPTVLFFFPVMTLLIGTPTIFKILDALKGGSF